MEIWGKLRAIRALSLRLPWSFKLEGGFPNNFQKTWRAHKGGCACVHRYLEVTPGDWELSMGFVTWLIHLAFSIP